MFFVRKIMCYYAVYVYGQKYGLPPRLYRSIPSPNVLSPLGRVRHQGMCDLYIVILFGSAVYSEFFELKYLSSEIMVTIYGKGVDWE